MKLLALDSTAVVASCAVCEDERLLSLFTVDNGNTHSETLLPMIEDALHLLGLTPDDIDVFACTTGPGSFTGVRIGAATVKGLAFGRGKPCIGVSTLEALAYNLAALDGLVCPVMNARRDQVYQALFAAQGGVLTRLCPDRAIGIADLEEELRGRTEPIYLCGDGMFLFEDSALSFAATPELLKRQSGYSVAQCALAAYRAGSYTNDISLAPTYLRPSQAERERQGVKE